MESRLGHIQINVSDSAKSFPFYRGLLGLLGYKAIHEDAQTLGMAASGQSVWLDQAGEKYKIAKFHRKNVGLNHLAFEVSKKEDVDLIVKDFVKAKGIATLYDTPKEFPEYMPGYYAVFFEDPDRVKLEVVYLPH